ncbi:MAG: nucleotide exchange factor GrpE [Acidobacteriota bacterium]|nr:nucleotide exchange factor GrpE [Acidobacteriota bacterium]
MSGKKVDIKIKKDHDQPASEASEIKTAASKEEELENKPPAPDELEEKEEIEYLEAGGSEGTAGEEEEREQPVTAGSEQVSGDRDKTIESLIFEVETKKREISELKSQLEELRDKLLRTLAEMDNLRKRTAREKEEYTRYALSSVFKELLPIIDNFERALKMSDETDGKTLKEGIELIYRLLLKLLARYGVKPIELEGERFDPAIHHALSSEESDEVSEPQIKEELQKGYLIHDRLLRPAMVRVLVPKKK